MIPDIRRRYLVLIGFACACLAACGSSASPTPSASTAPSAAVASTAPSASTAPIAARCTPTPLKFDPKSIDLTGAWAGDDDGIYYLRQRGTTVSWNGMSSRNGVPSLLGLDFNNVGWGEIHKDLTIAVDWADVPRGGIDGYGTMKLKIGPDSAGNIQITKVSETGTGFGNTVWTRCQPGFPTG
jgi:hypothetical protein